MNVMREGDWSSVGPLRELRSSQVPVDIDTMTVVKRLGTGAILRLHLRSLWSSEG